jgi:hypothetical protein
VDTEKDPKKMEEEKAERLAAASPFKFLVDSMLNVEQLRVSVQIRRTHLGLKGRSDEETDNLFERLQGLEAYLDERVALLLQEHPAHHWFSRVKGVGDENIAKIIGMVDITKAPTVSSLWSFAGYGVVDGKAPRREKGQKLAYNSQLRTMCWRLAGSLLKANGKYKAVYDKEKMKLSERFAREGRKIVPAAQLPKVDGKRAENEQFISEGHIHHMALRKMIKLFLSHLWQVWRGAEGLPVREPWAMQYGGHTTIITPWEMMEKPEKKPRKKAVA